MEKNSLVEAVERFSQLTAALPDERLDTPWKWQDYDEGVRFAFFRIYEELHALAANLASLRVDQSQPLTTAQRILAQDQIAYRELIPVLLTLTDEESHREPSPGQWSVWQALDHIIDAERNFFAVISFALSRARGFLPPEQPLDDAWVASFWAEAGDTYEQDYTRLSFPEIIEYYDSLRSRELADFAGITPEELSTPSEYWESKWMPVEFRLHRFDAHRRQHTIQIEKTLPLIGKPPGEALRLLRLVYSALGEVEGVMLGVSDLGMGSREALAGTIAQITDEIARALESPQSQPND